MEIEGCAGTGDGFCVAEFHDAEGKRKLYVFTTSGSLDEIRYVGHDPQIVSFCIDKKTVNCEQPMDANQIAALLDKPKTTSPPLLTRHELDRIGIAALVIIGIAGVGSLLLFIGRASKGGRSRQENLDAPSLPQFSQISDASATVGKSAGSDITSSLPHWRLPNGELVMSVAKEIGRWVASIVFLSVCSVYMFFFLHKFITDQEAAYLANKSAPPRPVSFEEFQLDGEQLARNHAKLVVVGHYMKFGGVEVLHPTGSAVADVNIDIPLITTDAPRDTRALFLQCSVTQLDCSVTVAGHAAMCTRSSILGSKHMPCLAVDDGWQAP
jgi:hypothetical protein